MQAKKQLISALGNKNEYIKADQLFLLSHRRKTVGDNKVRGDFKSSKQIKYKKQKYSLDKEIKINNKQWRIAEYKFRFGREWTYVLQHETVDGTYKILEFNERTLTTIVESGSEIVLKDEKV